MQLFVGDLPAGKRLFQAGGGDFQRLNEERSGNLDRLVVGVERLDDDLERFIAAAGVAVAAAGLPSEGQGADGAGGEGRLVAGVRRAGGGIAVEALQFHLQAFVDGVAAVDFFAGRL